MRSRTFSRLWSSIFALTLMAMAWHGALAQDLKSFEQRITTKVLPNGLTIIICERPEAPVFSYTTFVDAGDVNDPSGESGSGAHVRAPGLQGDQPDRHQGLRR